MTVDQVTSDDVDLVTLQQSFCKTPTKRTTRTTVINPQLTRIKGADPPPQCTLHTACKRTSGGRRVVRPHAAGA